MTQFNAEELAFKYMCETEIPRVLTPTDKKNLKNLAGKLNQAYTAGYNKAVEDAVTVCENLSSNYTNELEEKSGEKSWTGSLVRSGYDDCTKAISKLKKG